MAKSEAPKITVKLNKTGSFEPVTMYDAECLASHKIDQIFEVTPVEVDRSPQHLKLYWSVLGRVCKATGKWPNSNVLHRELKMACGYYTTVASKFGGIYYMPDSIDFKSMSQPEFNEFFEHTMAKLSETIGYDPLEQ